MTRTPSRPTIFLADELPLFRRGLRECVVEAGWTVVGEAASCAEAQEEICRTRPDLAVVGVEVRGVDGLEWLRRVRTCCPETRIVVISAFTSLETLLRAVEYGASGFLLKDAPAETLVDQLRRIAAGEFLLDTPWRLAILTEIQSKDRRRHPSAEPSPLTTREAEVLRAIGAGLNTSEVAEACRVSVHTVNSHIRNILRKLRVADRTQALVWAARRKLVTFEDPPATP